MLGSDKSENKNPAETGGRRKPTEKGNKMIWVKRDIPKKPYWNANGTPDWSRSAGAEWLYFPTLKSEQPLFCEYD